MLYNPRTVAAIAAASLLAAFAAQANKGAEYKPHHKEHHKNFFITGGATYLEPSFNGLDYVDFVNTTAGSIPSVNTELVEPEFNWGYFLQAGYRISHHYDVEASWAQYNSSISDSASATGVAGTTTGVITSNIVILDLTTGETAEAESTQNINYSVFDANLGQYHDITEMLRTRIFAGIRYAKVDADIDNTYFAATGSPSTIFDNYDSSFSGWGPEVGLDLEYKIWHTFGVVANLTAAFLIGQQESDSYVFNDDFGAQFTTETDSIVRTIPNLDARLGVNWNVPYVYEKFSFGVEAGYEVAYYWNAIDQVQVPGPADVATHNYSNYGNMGPYLNVTAMF